MIVVYIAPCLGGVFAEEPECYELVEGKIMNTWKRVIRGDDENRQEEIPSTIQQLTWSSTGTQRRCINTDDSLSGIVVSNELTDVNFDGANTSITAVNLR